MSLYLEARLVSFELVICVHDDAILLFRPVIQEVHRAQHGDLVANHVQRLVRLQGERDAYALAEKDQSR